MGAFLLHPSSSAGICNTPSVRRMAIADPARASLPSGRLFSSSPPSLQRPPSPARVSVGAKRAFWLFIDPYFLLGAPVAVTPTKPGACERRHQAGIPFIIWKQRVRLPPPFIAVGVILQRPSFRGTYLGRWKEERRC